MSKETKKFKMISIDYTYDCAKKPRCSFCYLKKNGMLDLLKGRNPAFLGGLIEYSKRYAVFKSLIERISQVAIAYNGLEIGNFLRIVEQIRGINPKVVINVTTNPEFLTPQVIALFGKVDIAMIALSLDPEKCTVEEWIDKSYWLRTVGLKVGVNLLMLDEVFKNVGRILKKIASYCQQIHLLRPKFYKSRVSKKKRREMIFLLKQLYPKKLFVDQCFRFELLGIPCTRGKDFMAIHPNGSITPCSFDLSDKPIKKLTKCPFI